ncbi:MAG: hypothetical protein AEth_01367 [Candidatus Argoarchaeum ethanivorans]|uniref:Probable pectate lyase C n=1 Tax=Candidatus Argoarchaeum ethanivorans TaxID=2608793 RepID=A0A8B3S168_9EURY|nr:MAG: hypothetical protein AEth_01367 [Candidatus Argoarchaeum ethanivorans]
MSCASIFFLLIIFCGIAGAVDYGEIIVTTTNDSQWSTNLSNNVSNVAGDIIVNGGAVLEIENATVKMDSTSSIKYSITVHNGGVMNINGSEITHKDTSTSDYYGWIYESGSRGNVTNTTIECCVHNNGFSIETNESVSIYNCTFRHGDGLNYVYVTTTTHGIYLHSASNASIRDCTIEAGHTKSHSYNYRVRYWHGIHIHDSNDNTLESITIAEKSSYYHGIYIQNSNNNTLNNISITRGSYSITTNDAVHLESTFNNTLRDFSIAGGNNKHGIHAYSSNNINVINSTINSVIDHGIYIQNSNYCNISENNVTDSGDYGIFMQSSENSTLLSNDLACNRDGMNLKSSTNNTLTGNTITDSSEYGINITSSHSSILKSNDIINSTDYNLYVKGNYDQDIDTTNEVNGGRVYYNCTDSNVTITDADIGHVTIVDCSDLWFTGCTIHNGDGIRIIGSSSNVSIRSSTIENNTVYGINLESTSWNNITSVIIENNTKQGFYLAGSSNNIINDSDILNNNNYGVHSEGSSSYNHVNYNNITNNTKGGICLDGAGHDDITHNNVSKNRGDGGICIGTYYYSSLSTQNTIANNTILSNNNTGIGAYTNYNYLSNNTISSLSGHYALKVSYVRNSFYNHIWRNNTANGEQINYYYDEHDKITELGDNIIENKYLFASNVSNVGKITLIDCTNLTIRNSEFSNNIKSGYGIFLRNSSNNNLTNNAISNNCNGIWLYGSSENSIIDLDTISPSNLYGAHFEEDSDHNNITDSSFAATTSNAMYLSSSDYTTITNTMISSVDRYGLYTIGAHYTNLTNTTITSTSSHSAYLSTSDYITLTDSNLTANNTCVYCSGSNYTKILNTTIRGEDGIYMSESNQGNLTNNTIDATLRGIFLTESRDHNLTANNITNYTITGILLEEHSTNATIIGNDLTRNSSEFDIRLNDSNYCVIVNNESVTANYTFYLTNDTRLATLDTVFNKTEVGYEDTSNLTLMWRIDVLCWDNYHIEFVWANLTVRYGEFSDIGNVTVWGENEIPLSNHGRLSSNDFDYYGPPASGDNWLPIIEYKENVTGKTTYQPMNCTAINRWDKIQGKNITYRNITTEITGPGVTILVDTGYTPNGKCYYCHLDKLKFKDTLHWTNYTSQVFNSLDEPYTPGQCIDCHNENDSIAIPHGNESGKDLLYNQSPQLCYTGKTGGLNCHGASATQERLVQETEFNQTTHHPLGDGKLSCKACHDNHGTEYDSDLLRYYRTNTEGNYNSANYALCFVCHLEEKLVAKMSGETNSHLQNYTNQTNFRDEYYHWGTGFGSTGTPMLQNIHSPQGGQAGWTGHPNYHCYSCHNPHGSDYPATTRPPIKYTYITNLTLPSGADNDGDWVNQTILDHANWSNSTMNQAGGLDNPSCGGCHGFKLPNSFNYRQPFVNYTPAGGAGCLECHDNNASAYNTDPIRPIVNLTAVKLAMHTNLSGAFRTGSDLQGTDKNFTEWLEYRGYTAPQIVNITGDNAICWACHCTNGTPPSPYFHPDRALNPYKCAKCHGPYDGQPPHTQGLVAAIDNHGPTTKGAESILIQTSVGIGGSCDDCHAPSVLPNSSIGELKVWKYTPSKSFITYTGRSTMGDVSHYGLNKTQGLAFGIDNPLFNTTDCLYCHCDSTNGSIWGNATYIADNMYGADTTNVSTCYTYCHVRPDWVGSVEESTLTHFHNESIYAGGGPNCTLCHDVNSKYGVQSLVNATAIKMGIHGNILNNTLVHETYGMDNRSNPCWGCHQSDGTIPEGMGDRNGITDRNEDGIITVDELPYTCEDCHARSEAWSGATGDGHTWESASDPALGLNRLPPLISDHYPNSTYVKTNQHSDNGRCVDCHNNSFNSDNNDTAYKELGHTIFSGVSHYGTTSSLLTPTTKCGYCHDNTTSARANATLYGNATANKHGNFTDEANPEDGCCFCHSHNQTPVDFHNINAVSIVGDPDCLRCHGSNGSAERRRIDEIAYMGAIHAGMNNASVDGDINKSCWVCHFPEGVGMDEHSNRLEPAYNCYDCHNKDNTTLFSNVSDAPEVHNHFKSGTCIEAYWTRPTDLDSCMGCHNQSEMRYTFDENETDPYFTNFSLISHYGDNRTDIVTTYIENDPGAYCGYCHDNLSTVFVEQQSMKKVNHYQIQTCDECHGVGRLHSGTLERVLTDANCTNCHATYGADQQGLKYKINVTAVNFGVHANVNDNMTSVAITVGDANNSKCWGCHVPEGACPEEGHRGTFNNDAYLCYECHNGTYAYQNVSNATAVYNHFKSGINISARTTAETNSESCGYGCHNLTTMKVSGFEGLAGQSSYRQNLSEASHYPRSRPDIATASNLSDCTWCHRNSTNEFIEIFERAGSQNYTENIPHATRTESCTITECHNTGRMHDQNLTIPTISWEQDCDNCHFGLDDSTASKYYVNETMFNYGVHATVNCTECHIHTDQPVNWHPLEEYTWKWCECCHSYQLDLINESDRHNVTGNPLTYMVGGTCVLEIANCTTCHDATTYENAKSNFNSSAEHECRWCHEYPDKGNKTIQSWY